MKHHAIAGGRGCLLHLIETGNPHGWPILFLHGFSQCSLAWSRQLSSALEADHRLIAVDLRGHGSSDKPRDGYGDSRVWADDVDAVIRELDLVQPILCGWSYGPLVILDYIRHYGDGAIGGIHFVDGITKLGSDEAVSVLAPDFLALVPGFFSSDVEESVRSLSSLLGMCFAAAPSGPDLYTMLGYGVAVPPFVRQALFSRAVDNDDLLNALGKPLLVTHGAADAIVSQSVLDQYRRVPHARIDVMPGAGHAPFWDHAASFNRRLALFVDEVASAGSGHLKVTGAPTGESRHPSVTGPATS
jgi:pimeloyl-ACP methyl ester carboxylesterase